MPDIPQTSLLHLPGAPHAAAPGRAPAPPGEAVAIPASAPALPNPALRLDPGLGIVVLEFRSAHGPAAETIPTRRELDAYRSAARTAAPPGQAQASNPASQEVGAVEPLLAAATT
ncbi:hypothetical protein [Siccirubricoccus sp. G192]|uniref:hypothetical protein n=1 Tax=Siccirubricoccus sp. G192 TaxID=2849651 RepID=UPI001C2C8AAB|nr:hypothetical protein [Siccirubricoccus sp. G192]MBV1797683.1 hypothetical protein [Siccirubricoccus sp. G192]